MGEIPDTIPHAQDSPVCIHDTCTFKLFVFFTVYESSNGLLVWLTLSSIQETLAIRFEFLDETLNNKQIKARR